MPQDELDDLIGRKFLVPEPLDGPYGLKKYPVSNPEGIHKTHDYFFGSYGPNVAVLLRCNRTDTAVPSPQCAATFHIERGVYLRYDFKLAHLQHWRSIDEYERSLIASFRR